MVADVLLTFLIVYLGLSLSYHLRKRHRHAWDKWSTPDLDHEDHLMQVRQCKSCGTVKRRRVF